MRIIDFYMVIMFLLLTHLEIGCSDDDDVGDSFSGGELVWVKSAGGQYGYEKGYGIAALPDGSALVTGSFLETATFGEGEVNETELTGAGAADVFVAKYNADGSLAWVKSAGGGDMDYGHGIAVLSDGSAVITGYYTETATFGQGEANETDLTTAGYQNIFVAKYGADGSLEWVKSAVSGQAAGQSVAVLPDGSVIVVGSFCDTATFSPGEADETTLFVTGYDYYVGFSEVFVAKYSADGTLAWVKAAGGCFEDFGNGIAALPDGSALVTGYFSHLATFGLGETNETTLTAGGERDIFIAGYSADGSLAWVKSAGESGYNAGNSIVALPDGSALVTGNYSGTATFGRGEANETELTAAGQRDIFVAKYRADGFLEWAKGAGGVIGDDEGSEIIALPDGSALVTGSFGETATFAQGETNEAELTSTGNRDIFVAKYSADGLLEWVRNAGGEGGAGEGKSIAALSDGSGLVTGSFENTSTFGQGEANQTELTSAGYQDIFVAKFRP